MPETEQPQIYLITPPEIDLEIFPDRLAKVLDAHPVACLRMALSTKSEDTLLRAGDALRTVAHARDVAVVIEDHGGFVERLGLDGVHLSDGARAVRKLRKDLGADAIVGAFCGASRHDGMNAGEAGADYVSFGPVGTTGLGHGEPAALELFEWWSQVIEVPVVAEGALDLERASALASITDFIALGAEIWGTDDPVAALGAYVKAIS